MDEIEKNKYNNDNYLVFYLAPKVNEINDEK